MKARIIFSLLLVAIASVAAGWWLGSRTHAHASRPSGAVPSAAARRILFYQSAMHPWIRSDKPGKCTICGMELTPVYEGDRPVEVADGLVMLPSNSITVLGVQTVPVRRLPLAHTLRVAGTIDDNDTRHRILSAYVDGRIDRLFVNYVGAEVKAGEPLATFFSPMLLAAEREYATLKRQSADPTLLTAAAQRLRQFGLSEAQIAGAADKPATNIHSELLAPGTGTVVARHVYEGQYVKEGERLFEIADFSTMWFVFDVYERDLSWLQLGQRLRVTATALPGRVLEARVTFIDPNLNPTSRTARVRAELPNPVIEENGRRRRELLHKVYAEAIVTVESPEALVVPRGAVLSPGGRPVVYVDRGGGAYEQRAIKLGRLADEVWEVLEGLSETDAVVVQGNLLLDAQAQLNQSAAPPVSRAEQATAPLTETQRTAAQELLSAIHAVGAALAEDRLENFNRELARLHTAGPGFLRTVAGSPVWEPPAARVEAAAHIANAPNLQAARRSFAPLSDAGVELARRLRAADSAFASLKIYLCPMTEDAFPGAPKKARWLQLAPPLRNPYFGAEMLECGQEVK